MKRILLLLLLTLTGYALHAKDADSLMIQREDLYYRYLDLRNNTEKFTAKEYESLSLLLEELVLLDNRVLDTLAARDARLEKLQAALAMSQSEVKATMSAKDQDMMWILIGGGAALLFFVLCIVLLILRMSSVRALKALRAESESAVLIRQADEERIKEELSVYESKLMDKDTMIKKLIREKEALQLQLSESEAKLPEASIAAEQTVAEYKQQAEQMKATIHDLKDVIDNFEETVREKDHQIEHLRAEALELQQQLADRDLKLEDFRQRSAHDEEFYRKLGEIDLNIVKLEKLDRLRDKQILSIEQYQALKQKYLDQL